MNHILNEVSGGFGIRGSIAHHTELGLGGLHQVVVWLATAFTAFHQVPLTPFRGLLVSGGWTVGKQFCEPISLKGLVELGLCRGSHLLELLPC